MSDNFGTTEGNDSQDSGVLNEVRKQLRDANKRVEALTQGKLATDREVLKNAGFENITPLYEKELKDNPTITPGDFLENYGLAANEPVVADAEPEPAPVEDNPEPNDVSGLAQQVASAATGTSDPTAELLKKLQATGSGAELDRIISEYSR